MKKIRVDFPLRGEWTAAHTPAEKVPSHGVDVLGQTYAFDFVRIDWEKEGFRFHGRSKLRYFTVGVNVKDCYGYGDPIFSPVDGVVVAAKDGLDDHKWLHPIVDLLATYVSAISFVLRKNPNIHKIAGNYIILKMKGIEAYAFFAHIKKNTIKVREGKEVKSGQHLADVGHTGNSAAPHLHFHVMDRLDLLSAKGLPCVFRKYEVFRNGAWVVKTNDVPALRERFKSSFSADRG